MNIVRRTTVPRVSLCGPANCWHSLSVRCGAARSTNPFTSSPSFRPQRSWSHLDHHRSSRSGSRNDHSHLSDGMQYQRRRSHIPDFKGFFRYCPYFRNRVDGAWQTLSHVFLSCSGEVWEIHGTLARPHRDLVCHREIVPQYSFVIPDLCHYKVPFYGSSSQGHGESRAANGSIVHGHLRLNSLLLPFFFEEYLGVRIHACGHPRSARRRSYTTVTSVTSVPLSVCWSVWILLTSFPMRVTGRSRREYEGPESTAPSSAISGGSVAAERSYRTPGTLPPVFPVLRVAFALGPYACSISFLFYNRPSSLISMPPVSSQVPFLVPQEKKSARCCRFQSLSDSGFIAQKMACYRPYKARTDISLTYKRVT